jgi:hypothetical protein
VLTNPNSIKIIHRYSRKRLSDTALILALYSASFPIDALGDNLHDPDVTRSLAFEDSHLGSITAFTPEFIPPLISGANACPSPPSDADCTLEYEPATCGDGCSYPNACIAVAALGVDEIPCVGSPLLFDENRNPVYGVIGLSNDPTCPLPDAEADCPFEFKPFKCGGCIYINDCAAESADFIVDTECQPAESTEDTCPPPPADADCTLEYEPATCNGCPYPNACIAVAALNGIEDISCVASPVQLDNNENPVAEADCPFDFKPLKCGGCI